MARSTRDWISKTDALSIATQAMHSSRAVNALVLVREALQKRGLIYSDNALSMERAEYMADDIVHFARPIGYR